MREMDEAMKVQNEIATCKQLLKQTDYMAIKNLEGVIPDEDYAEIKAKRQEWRDKINELEAAQEE